MLNISLNDRFFLRHIPDPGEFVVSDLGGNKVSLIRYPRGPAISLGATEFAVLHSEGDITITAKAGQEVKSLNVRNLLALFTPEGRKVTAGELKDQQDEFAKLIAAATKQFYANRYIDHRKQAGTFMKTEDDLAEFIAAQHAEAMKRGFGKWMPSPSTIRRLVYGTSTYISLIDCMRKTGGARERAIWPSWVYELADDALGRIVMREFADPGVAYAWFYGEFFRERDEGQGIDPVMRQRPPGERTFRNWFRQYCTPDKMVQMYGEREVNRRLKGTITPQDARYPLHVVIIDQTLGNIWSAVKQQTEPLSYDEHALARASRPSTGTDDGKLASKRVEVVYAIDTFTRVTLGLVLTFEPPSIATFMACLKMVMSPKTSWASQFPDLPDATDGYGAPVTVVVDNLGAHVSESVQLGLLAMGIGLEYAALASPEWKAVVERAIGTVKGVMAKLPGGFPITEEVNSADYQKYARYDLGEINDLVVHQIVTEHHMRIHKGTNEPPAYRWARNLPLHGRGMVPDMRMLDHMLRRRAKATVSTSGIVFKGHRFHNEGLTTRLLHGRSGEAARKPGRSARFEVDILWNPMDVTSLGVIDPSTNEMLFFQNVDKVFADIKVSFDFALAARRENEKIFDEYYPAEVRAKYLRAFFAKLERELPEQTHRVGKRTARLLEGGRAVMIPPDVQQFEITIPVTDLGVSKVDVPIQPPIERIGTLTETPKKPGPKRRAKQSRKIEAVDPPRPRDSGLLPASFALSLEESEAYLDLLETRQHETRH